MADTTFTMLGMTGSGKTCFIAAMWSQMSSGIDGFTIVTDDETRFKLQRDVIKLTQTKSPERFPQATSTSTESIKYYEFELNKDLERIISIKILDYAGGSLNGNGNDVLHIVEESIAESTALLIFIDGELFCTEDKEKRADNIKYDCANTITPILDYYSKSHPKQPLPPVIFVVTKLDLFAKYISQEEIVNLIRHNFSPAFGANKTKSYICAITLGESISEDNYSGRFCPLNIHIPFFIGAYHEFYNRYTNLKAKLTKENQELELDCASLKSALAIEKQKWKIFRRKKYIENLEKQLNKKNNTRLENDNVLDRSKFLLTSFGSYLEHESSGFKSFVDGIEQPTFRAYKS